MGLADSVTYQEDLDYRVGLYPSTVPDVTRPADVELGKICPGSVIAAAATTEVLCYTSMARVLRQLECLRP